MTPMKLLIRASIFLIFLGLLFIPGQEIPAHALPSFSRSAPWIAAIIAASAAILASIRVVRYFRFSLEAAGETRTALVPARMDGVDREFLPAALELFETPPSPVRIAAIWAICLLFATLLLWAYFGWLEIYAVAQGRIQPSGRSKIVQPVDSGRVVAVRVKNGSKVSPGDVLVELDARETAAELDEQERDLGSALAEAARRRVAIAVATAGGRQPQPVTYPEETSDEIKEREDAVLAADIAQLVSNKASLLAQRFERLATKGRLKGSLAARERLIAVDKEHVEMREVLNQTKAASRAQVIETLQQFEQQVTTQASEQGQLEENEASLLTLDRKLEEVTAQFISDQTQKLAEALRKADHLRGELVKASTKHERTKLSAPIGGTVQQLAVTTLGQVVSPGQTLMTIVPFDAPIEIEALIQNQDIGFVEPGQSAVVKIESFPFTRYGTVDGTVAYVSRDAVDDREANALSDPKSGSKPLGSSTSLTDVSKGQNLVFPATIALAKNSILVDGKEIPLSPGMSVTVEVLTGKRRALDYLLSPLREIVSSSAHER
jgi:hemolysin D